MEATIVRMEAVTKEKDKLIASLNRKVELFESSVIKKEGEGRVKQQHTDCILKEKEMSGNIQTLAMSFNEG